MSDAIVRDAIRALPVYNSGAPLDVVRRELGLTELAKLDSNENPLGMSPAAEAAARAALHEANRYPDRDETTLREMIAGALAVNADRLVFSGGSEDVLSIIYRMILEPDHAVVTTSPGFGLHAIYAQVAGATVHLCQHLADWSFPVDEIVSHMRDGARIVAIASPSNPVGAMLTRADIDAILDAAGDHCMVIFDEAYIEFAGAQWQRYVLQRLRMHHGPWAVLRTFAKAYGMAGMRIGYGIVYSAGFAANFHKTRSPFNVNAVALAAAEAAFADEEHMRRSVAELCARRDVMASALAQQGFMSAPSSGNFLFVDTGADSRLFADALKRRGVLVKPWLETGYTTFVRATVGLEQECATLIEAMAAVRAELD
ncbi:MAG: histidinol-phosphate transaminase [Pseudomonadota bacterium]